LRSLHRACRLCLPLLAALLAASPGLAGKDRPERDGGKRGGQSPRPPGPELCLILDYLPALMYSGERLAYSFRVARRRDLQEDLAFEISWHFTGAEHKPRRLAPGSSSGSAEKDFTVVRGFLRVPRGADHFHFGLSSGKRDLGSGRARLVDERDEWPRGARAAWGRLVDSRGVPLILTLRERVPRVDNRWKPIRWLWEKGRSRAESVLVAGPRLAAAGKKSYQDLLAGSAEKLRVLELPEAAGRGRRAAPAHGIYRLIELVESQVIPAVRGGKGVDLVVLVTPQEDPEMATEPRRYRQGLDWVLARLKRAGAGRVAIVPPLTRRVPARQLAAYAEICRKAAAVYAKQVGARCLDVGPLAEREYWRPEGALGRVTGRYPNEKGQRKLAELIRSAYN
jgi:hypothetical protein